MTLVLNGKGLLLEGSNPKIEDKQIPGAYVPRTQMEPPCFDRKFRPRFRGGLTFKKKGHEGAPWF